MLPPNMPMVTGKQAVRAVWAQLMGNGNPGFTVSWESSKAEVSRSGDFAYDIGTYQLTMNDPQGKPNSDRGKYMVVWKKQADGKWKAVGDMFKSDLSLLPSPPEKQKK
jgi:ketosteroid isomerase-like protein